MWKRTIKIKHLFTEEEDYKSVQKSMNLVADKLQNYPCFKIDTDLLENMRAIPEDDICGIAPIDFANRLIDKMYNIADSERIWIE